MEKAVVTELAMKPSRGAVRWWARKRRRNEGSVMR
jgi:hypothetical protein